MIFSELAKLDEFRTAKKSDQAEFILWAIFENNGGASVPLAAVIDAFHKLHLPKPNPTRLRDHFRKSRNVRRVNENYAPIRDFIEKCQSLANGPNELPEEVLDVASITLPPFVDMGRQKDLAKMVKVYAQLFLLENSMRGLIETVLKNYLGEDWWQSASNSEMRRKHQSREDNEKSNKWAPARSDFGPLYALDWSDLIKLMRKYPDQFLPYIGDINFLHRFEDTGTFRNIVAHNGVLRDDDDFGLIRIYYKNWIDQLTKA